MTGRQVLIASWGLVALVFAGLFLDTYLLMRRDAYAGSVWKDGFAQFFLGGLSVAIGSAATIWGARGRVAGAVLIGAALALGVVALLALAFAGMGGGHTSTSPRLSLAIPVMLAIFTFPPIAIATLIVGVVELRGMQNESKD
jgi:hypothetical protein